MSNEILSTREVGTVAIWGCGGGGSNIAKKFDSEPLQADIAKLSVRYLDTSDSNLTDSQAKNAYLYKSIEGEDLDGSGMLKSKNAEAIEKATPEVIRKFPSAYANIVVSTASGGTGNVAAYYLTKALVEAGKRVFVVLIGSSENERKVKNVITSVANLQDLSEELGKNIVFHWGMNKKGVLRSTVDAEAELMITALAILCSRRNVGFDTADLDSFINYNLPKPEFKPTLSRIQVYDNAEKFDEAQKNVISAVYLTRGPDEPQPSVFAPYSTDGFLPDVAQKNNLFFGIETHSLHGIHKELAALHAELEAAEKNRTTNTTASFAGLTGVNGKKKKGPILD